MYLLRVKLYNFYSALCQHILLYIYLLLAFFTVWWHYELVWTIRVCVCVCVWGRGGITWIPPCHLEACKGGGGEGNSWLPFSWYQFRTSAGCLTTLYICVGGPRLPTVLLPRILPHPPPSCVVVFFIIRWHLNYICVLSPHRHCVTRL
jgi:hypothetical protein